MNKIINTITGSNPQEKIESETLKIKQLMSKLIQEYRPDKNMCAKTKLVYTDRLKQFKIPSINGVALEVGIIAEGREPQLKQELCKSLVEHYQKRVVLIENINSSINYCCNRIFALTGISDKEIFKNLEIESNFEFGRCLHDSNIFTIEECDDSWQSFIVKPDQRQPGNQNWYNNLSELQTTYLSTLEKLFAILEEINNANNQVDEQITEEELDKLSNEVAELTENLNDTVNKIYTRIIVLKTETGSVLPDGNITQDMTNEQRNLEAKQRAAALRAAARMKAGLPPIPPSTYDPDKIIG